MKMPMPPPELQRLWARARDDDRLAVILRHADPAPGGWYSHWQTLRHREPPQGLTSEEWWLGIKLARSNYARFLPLRDTEGEPFRLTRVDPLVEMFSQVDQRASGRIEVPEVVQNPDTRDRYLISSLMDEAITSSQLEGAATTTRVAEQMLRTGRKPRDRSERMIVNNFRAMNEVRKIRREELAPELVFDLQRTVTEGTLEDPDSAGRFRTDRDEIVVRDTWDDEILHVPPKAGELPERLEAMCAFANGKTPDFYLHGVERAILLHFWLAYDHPFVDGNGRTARALFYWSMLRQGYWLTEYISISHQVKRAPGRYKRAFIYSETDENDTTYFLLYHLRMILDALDELDRYLERKVRAVRRAERHLRAAGELNHRQMALVAHALRHPGFEYTIRSHRTSHGVVYQTARTDLLDLVDRGILSKSKRGRTYIFRPRSDLEEWLKQKGEVPRA